jgi:acetyl-CoA synthetase
MQRLGFTSREEFLRWSTADPDVFYRALDQELGIEWFRRFDGVVDMSRGPEWARWFEGGRINLAHNCLDRHAAHQMALLWESEAHPVTDGPVALRALTFGQLQDRANRLAHALRGMGVEAGDRVAICLPMTPEAVVALYGAWKIGAVVVPVFSGFGLAAIRSRLEDSGARVGITCDQIRRRGKILPLREKVAEASRGLEMRTLVWRYQGLPYPREAGDEDWGEALGSASNEPVCEALDSEHPAMLLYTSGTTGRPKGTVHTHAGTLMHVAKEMHLAFDHQEGDRFFWVTDMGWMMGPWMVIGNHHFGGTIVMYDGAPDFPAADRLWATVARHRATVLGVSPTAIRMLMRRDAEGPGRWDLSALRLLGSTGEPWDETSYEWFFERVGGGRCPVLNISGGTEIMGCFLMPLPIQELKACSLGGPAPGMAVDCVDEAGAPVRGGLGHLVCRRPGPSMTRGIWGSPERYLETYWSRFAGMWWHGDWASVDEDGEWFLHGRSDDSLNVAGRKVGPAEVEAVLCGHPAVAEAAVIGVPDEVLGEAIVAFVVVRSGVEESELARYCGDEMGSAFRPRRVHEVAELPKTQSGKIVRRLIRQKYLGEELGDVSTVENVGALDLFAPPPE